MRIKEVLDKLDHGSTKAEVHDELEALLKANGCKEIYSPGDKAFEYSPVVIIPYDNCGYGCAVYCYRIPMLGKIYAARFPHLDWDECLDAADREFRSGATPKPGFMTRYLRDLEVVDELGIEQITMSYGGDVYPRRPINSMMTREIIIATHDRTNAGTMVITKGGRLALRDIDQFDPERDCHMFTLSSLNEKYWRKWEGSTDSPMGRIEAAKAIKAKGGKVIQSAEPVWNVNEAFEAMRACYSFVDGIYLGPASLIGHQELKTISDKKLWRPLTEDEHRELVEKAVDAFGDKVYTKDALLGVVPDGFKERNLRNMWRQLRH
jgi:DNA repair photolyase